MERLRSAISGSHGFVGEHLCNRLDQFSVEYIRLDRSGNIPNDIGMIYDLAGYGNIAGQTEALKIYNANLMRVINTTETMGDAKLLYVSTSSVLLPVQTHYSASKKATEEFLKLSGKRYAIARPYSVTGVGEQSVHLIPKLIDSCLNGTEMPFVAEPVHDFIDVWDFVNALILIGMEGKLAGEVYDIGSGHQVRNEDVKDMVEQATGKKANVKYIDSMRTYDTKEWRADNRLIRSLGWKPLKTLYESIQDMVYERNQAKNIRH